MPNEIAVIAEVLEMLMIVCFGISWPINVVKAYRSRTAKGKSILFDYIVATGYLLGLAGKIISCNFNLAYYFYYPNLVMVMTDILLYYRNRKLDKQ